MKKLLLVIVSLSFIFNSCKEEEIINDNYSPLVKADSTFNVIKDEDVIYANGLCHDESSTIPFSLPLKLDIYKPENIYDNRPVFMWIHGGGFTGGIKHNPEIIKMANYYASRGWVFISIDYRTTEELGNTQGMNEQEVLAYYRGIAPNEWIDTLLNNAQTLGNFKKGIASYMAVRDSKAALRWIIANSNTYKINTDYITVGGNSAGSATTIALGISNIDDFRDEISISDDPTLSSTNLNETYIVSSLVYFWGSNTVLDTHEMVYGLEQYDRYDANDPELFLGHGQADSTQTPFEEALELQSIYESLGVYNNLVTLFLPNGNAAGHGAWDAVVNGKELSELTFDFLIERQNLTVE